MKACKISTPCGRCYCRSIFIKSQCDSQSAIFAVRAGIMGTCNQNQKRNCWKVNASCSRWSSEYFIIHSKYTGLLKMIERTRWNLWRTMMFPTSCEKHLVGNSMMVHKLLAWLSLEILFLTFSLRFLLILIFFFFRRFFSYHESSFLMGLTLGFTQETRQNFPSEIGSNAPFDISEIVLFDSASCTTMNA